MIECQWSQQKNICKSHMGQDQVSGRVRYPYVKLCLAGATIGASQNSNWSALLCIH